MKKSFLTGKLLAVVISVVLGMILSLSAGFIFSKGLLFDFRIYSLYVVKMYIKANWQGIIAGGLISSLIILSVIERKYIFNVCGRFTQKLDDTQRARLLLAFAVIAGFAVIYGGYIFGGRYLLFSDAGMDTICQFYPMYVHLTDEIREGTLSLWNFDWGLGCDTLTRQEWIMDPCAWMAVAGGLLFGTEAIKHILLITQFIKVMACALCCFEFTGFYGFSPKARFTASCLFAFNGWLMLWGQHYYFGMACVYLIILLWLVERMLAAYRKISRMEWHYLSVGLVVALIFIYSVYFGYMIVVFSSVYTIMRMLYLGYGDEKRILASLWRELWPVIVTVLLGMLCASVMIIPYADIVLNVSTRLEGSFIERMKQYVAALYSGDYYMTLAGRMISNNTFGILALDQKYYELPQLSFSTLSLIVVPQVFWFGVIRPVDNTWGRKRILRILMAVLMVLALTWPFVGAVFNMGLGESLESGVPVMRFAFVLMPLFALIYAYFVDECLCKCNINRGLLPVSGAAVYAVLYYAYWNYRIHYRWVNGALAAINLAFVLMLVVMRCQSGRKRTSGEKIFKENIIYMALLCLLGSACFDGYAANELRYTYDNTTECMSEDFHGRKTMDVLDYIKSIDDSFYRVEKVYYDFSTTGDSMVQNYSPFSMYCSTMSGYIKKFYEISYPHEEYKYPSSDVDYNEYDNAFAITNVKYIISCFPLDWDYLEPVCEINGVYAYRNTHAGSIGTVYHAVMGYSEFEKLSENERKNVLADMLLLPDDEAGKAARMMQGSAMSDPGAMQAAGAKPDRSAYFAKKSDAYISGRVNAESDGMLMLSVPYRKGWNVYVDGIRQDTVNADYGFMAVRITAGEHDVLIKYENKLYLIGIAACLSGVILMAVWVAYVKKSAYFRNDVKGK